MFDIRSAIIRQYDQIFQTYLTITDDDRRRASPAQFAQTDQQSNNMLWLIEHSFPLTFTPLNNSPWLPLLKHKGLANPIHSPNPNSNPKLIPLTSTKRLGITSVIFMSVCLPGDNFRKPRCRKFRFVPPLYLQRIRVKFVYEGHRVKVKVTGTKKIENLYSRNVKFRSEIAPVL